MIQIYSVNNTNYEKNGDALLPSSAYVHVILNGAWEAELTHPLDKEGRWKNIVEEAVVKMPSFNGNQLFRIKAVEKQDSGVTATMEPIFYDAMNDCFLEDIRPNGDNGQVALTKMLSPNNKYSASSNITKTATAYYQYVNFLEALNGDLDQAFIKRWGGEILFDNYTVIVNSHVGGDYGAELRYGKNIPKNGMSFDVDNRDIVTRIYPKAYEGRMMSNNGHVDSPLINNYPTVKAATITFENVKLSSDLQGDPEDTDIVCDTQAELDQALEEMCEAQFDAGLDKPKVTISVDMILLQNTEQYKDVKDLEEVSLGDTVRIYNRHLGIMSEARIIELEYDAIRKKVSSVVIGDYEYNYFNDVSSATEIIKNVVNPDGTLMAERVQGILNGVYTQLRLQSTAAQKVDGVAFKVEELDDESPLYGCMIWGTQGIQISTTRTADGKDWDWTTAITAKGIVANAIITGLLSDKTGSNYWDLDTGEFRLSPTATVGGNAIATKNNTISNVDVEYASGTSNTTPPVTGWSTNSPEWQDNRYIWQRTVTTMADGTQNISEPTCIQGAAGADGSQGVPGPPGDDGQTLYTWIKYADTPTSGMSDTPDGKKYLGIAYNKTSPVESTNYSDYLWSDIKGEDGVPGTPGENGETLYTWIKYAASASGANMSDNPTGRDYIGIAYNKTTATESTNPSDYAWSLIQGEAGIGVKGIVEQYYLSNSSTTQTGGSWSTAQPKWQKGKYIWTRSKITWTDNSVTYTDPVLAKAINGANEAVDDLDTSLNQQEVFNRLTNNGKAQGIILQNGQLYINAEYIQSLILKVGGANNENGTFEVYNGSGILVGKIDKDGAKFTNGSDWLQISQSLLTGGYGSTTDGLLDLSANYSTGRHVVLESKTGDVILKSADDFRVQRQSGGMGYLVQSGGTDYFGKPTVSYGDTYTIIGIMYGEDDVSNEPFFDVRLSNGQQKTFFAGSRGGSVDPGYGYMDSPIFDATTTQTFVCNSTMEVSGNIWCFTINAQSPPNLYNLSHVTSGGHLVFASNGITVAYLASSSKRYKDHVSDMSDEEALKILDIPVIKFKYKDGYLFPTDFLVDKEIPGFYAEDVEEVNPILCQYNEDGSVEDWNYRTMIPYMLKTMQIQQKRIDDLEARIAKLEKGEVNA